MKKLFLILLMAISVNVLSPIFATAQTTEVKTKTSGSHKKKSTIISAGAGAATGAIVSKKKGKGAVIGGAIGAGAGYMYGRHRDKKHPRTVRKTKVTTKN